MAGTEAQDTITLNITIQFRYYEAISMRKYISKLKQNPDNQCTFLYLIKIVFFISFLIMTGKETFSEINGGVFNHPSIVSDKYVYMRYWWGRIYELLFASFSYHGV